MSSITIQEEADFVITLINVDLAKLGSDNRKLTYLKLIGDQIDNLGEDILSNNPQAFSDPKLVNTGKPIGEIREEMNISDIELFDSPDIKVLSLPNGVGSLLDILFGEIPVLGALDFLRSSECLKGDDAKAWLYKRKYTHEYEHIHVFPHDLCLLMGETELTWIEPDGVRSEGEDCKVMKDMFIEYTTREANA